MFYYMEKNNFEHCIESVDKVRNITENIKMRNRLI